MEEGVGRSSRDALVILIIGSMFTMLFFFIFIVLNLKILNFMQYSAYTIYFEDGKNFFCTKVLEPTINIA